MTACAHDATDKPCGTPAQRTSKFCFFHDPDKKAERQEATSRGGHANKHPLASILAKTAKEPPKSWEHVRQRLVDTINLLLNGQATVDQAKVVSGWVATRLQVVRPGVSSQDGRPATDVDNADRQAWDAYYCDLERRYGATVVRVIRNPESREECFAYSGTSGMRRRQPSCESSTPTGSKRRSWKSRSVGAHFLSAHRHEPARVF